MIWHDVVQNSDEWMELRLGKVTMSNAGKFMANLGKSFGDPAKDYALKLALELETGKRSEFGFRNDDMDRGLMQEPIARMLYEEDQFVSVTNGGFFDHYEYGDSPDGLVNDDGIIEIKSVIPTAHYANIRRGAADPAYKWQLIGHLDCTGREWVDFVSYCSDFTENKQIIIYRTYRQNVESELQQLAERRSEFISYIESIRAAIK